MGNLPHLNQEDEESMKKMSKMLEMFDGFNGSIQENLTNIRVVKAFVRSKYEKDKFKTANDNLLAAALHADKCEIYTDVDGVFTADPRVVPDARKIEEITYDEMLELATSGAKVLHSRSVELAKKYGVQMVVRSSLNESEGTTVKEVVKMEKMLVTGVASDKNTARISVIGVEDKPGVAFKVFHRLAKNNINIDIILQSVGRDGSKDISFTVAEDDLEDAIKVLEENKEALTIKEIKHSARVAKVAIVGAGMMSNPGVAAKMFEILFNFGVNINMISTSEIKISCIVDEMQINEAVLALHTAFGLDK